MYMSADMYACTDTCSESTSHQAETQTQSAERRANGRGPLGAEGGLPQSWMRRLMRGYAQVLVTPVGKACVLLVFGTLVGLMTFVALEKTTTGFELQDLTPDVSYVRDFFAVKEAQFGSVMGKLKTTLYFMHADYASGDVQMLMTEVSHALLSLPPSLPLSLSLFSVSRMCALSPAHARTHALYIHIFMCIYIDTYVCI